MQIGRELGERSEVTAVALEGMARLAMVQGSHSWAVQLWAKARWWRETIEVRLMPGQLRTMERWLAQLRALLGEKPFTDLWEGGRTLSLDEVWLASPKPLPTGETNVPETWLDGK